MKVSRTRGQGAQPRRHIQQPESCAPAALVRDGKARAAAPALPRALLLERLAGGWLDAAASLGAVAMVVHRSALYSVAIQQVLQRCLRVLSYTVNDAAEEQRLIDAGVDGLITDAVNRLGAAAPAAAC